MLITITEDHLSEGEPRKCATCPVAMAMRAAGCTFPLVRYKQISWGPCDRRSCVATPEIIERFLRKIDGGQDVEPSTFDLEGVAK